MFIDIAFNATSEQFKGKLDEVIQNARSNNVFPLLVGLDIDSSNECLELSEKYDLFCYFGVHPLSFTEYDSLEDFKNKFETALGKALENAHTNRRIIAIGECGLDYFRADNKEAQKDAFRIQIDAYRKYNLNLPFFFHCRAAHRDFIEEVAGLTGVVHSFDGTFEEANLLIQKGFYIGINGCSMRTEENIDVVRKIPIENILLETDSPYCLIKKSYAAFKYLQEYKKFRCNEPALVIQNAVALANIKQISLEEVERICFENTLKAFPRLREFFNSK